MKLVQVYILRQANDLLRRFPGARLRFESSGVAVGGGVATTEGVAGVPGRAATANSNPFDGPAGPGPVYGMYI